MFCGNRSTNYLLKSDVNFDLSLHFDFKIRDKKHNSFIFEDRSVKLCTVIGLVIPFKYLTSIFDISFHIDLKLEGQKFKITINQSLLKLEPWIFYDNMSTHSLGSQYNFDLSLVFDLNLGIKMAGLLSHLTSFQSFSKFHGIYHNHIRDDFNIIFLFHLSMDHWMK